MDLLLTEPSAEAQDQQEQHGSHAGEAAIRSPAKQNKYFIRLLTVPFQLEEKTNCHCQTGRSEPAEEELPLSGSLDPSLVLCSR